MAATFEGIELKAVSAALSAIVAESFTEETNGYTFTIPADEPSGERVHPIARTRRREASGSIDGSE